MAEGLGSALRELGLDAVTTAEAGRKGATDPRQLLFATEAERILITHNNADCRMLHEALALWAVWWNALDRVRHSGILIIEQGAPRRGGLGVPTMIAIVRALPAGESMTNRLFAWNDRRGLHEVVA
jgi:hypothetical protein